MSARPLIPQSLPQPRHRSAFRRLAQHALAWLLYRSGALALAKRSLRKRGAVVVLALHRVLDERGWQESHSLKAIVVKRTTFEALAARAAASYHCVDASSVWPGQSSPRAMLAFTFDDGWADNLEHALPALTAHGIPATIFLCTGTTGTLSPFWPERLVAALRQAHPQADEDAIQQVVESFKTDEPQDVLAGLVSRLSDSAPSDVDRTLTWDEVLSLRSTGVRFGSHTHSHPILTRVPLDNVAEESRRSRSELEQRLAEPCLGMAYPNGDWSPEVAETVKAQGFRRAFTMQRAAWLRDTNQFAIPRSNVQEADLAGLDGRFSVAMFEYTTFWKAWLRLRRQPFTRAGARA